ncbi:MAG: DUF2381 family protein [Myxococcales bacterium]|nr:DUF2381 family protein [Myxococcales bacterium]
MRPVTLATLALAVVLAAITARPAAAQKSCDFLVPPSGGAFEIAVHPAYLTSLQFPNKLTSANTSDLAEYEIRKDGDTGLLIRPKAASVPPANINAQSGPIRVSVGLRTVADAKDACALVTFTATTEEEARQRAIDEAVAAQTAALKAEVAAVKRDIAAQVRAQLDAAIADRAMARLDLARLTAVERNDDGVVVWALRAVYLGSALLVNVEIENRSGATFRVAGLELRDGAKNLATAARLATGASAGIVGTVASGAKVRGVVVVRDASQLTGKDLVLVVRTPDGKGQITVRKLGLR